MLKISESVVYAIDAYHYIRQELIGKRFRKDDVENGNIRFLTFLQRIRIRNLFKMEGVLEACKDEEFKQKVINYFQNKFSIGLGSHDDVKYYNQMLMIQITNYVNLCASRPIDQLPGVFVHDEVQC